MVYLLPRALASPAGIMRNTEWPCIQSALPTWSPSAVRQRLLELCAYARTLSNRLTLCGNPCGMTLSGSFLVKVWTAFFFVYWRYAWMSTLVWEILDVWHFWNSHIVKPWKCTFCPHECTRTLNNRVVKDGMHLYKIAWRPRKSRGRQPEGSRESWPLLDMAEPLTKARSLTGIQEIRTTWSKGGAPRCLFVLAKLMGANW